MQNFIIDYVNENEFRKKEKSIKKYNMLAYKKLMFEYYPALKEGNFMGVITSTNKAEGITKYDLKLPTDRTFSKVYGDIVLHYTVYENQKISYYCFFGYFYCIYTHLIFCIRQIIICQYDLRRELLCSKIC